MRRTALTCRPDQPAGLDQSAGFLGLRPQREADHDKRQAKQQARDRNAAVGPPIGGVKGRDHTGSSEHEARQLIERIGDFRAHDDERCDHQKEAKPHQIRKPNTLLRLAHRCEEPGTKIKYAWVMTVLFLGRVAANVNHFPTSC
jgi:hypothetical protein